MKQSLISVLLFIFLLTATGCAGKNNTKEAGQEQDINAENSKEQESGTAEQTDGQQSGTDGIGEVNLQELSKELVLQMEAGDFNRTYQLLEASIKAQMTEPDLKAAWEGTIAGLGKYLELYEITENTVQDATVVIVILKYENNGFRITLTYNKDNKLAGLWLDYVTIDMKLETTDLYTEQAIKAGEGEYTLDGILTLPNNVTKPPVVILVHGSGTHDWDETISANKPFRDIAHRLAEQGIATIRYRERLAKYPELASAITIQTDSLEDAALAIQYAVQCGQVDTEKIYVLGHSLGGMLAPKIAADHEEVAGILSLAGSPRRLEDIIIDQQELLTGISGEYTEDQIKDIMELTREQAGQIRLLTEESTGDYFGMPASYWYSLNQIDIPKILETLDVPMFIAQGGADWQVYADKDFPAWKELLKNRDNVTFHLYDNLNHLFMTSSSETVNMAEYEVPGTVDRQVIDDMAEWILGN